MKKLIIPTIALIVLTSMNVVATNSNIKIESENSDPYINHSKEQKMKLRINIL